MPSSGLRSAFSVTAISRPNASVSSRLPTVVSDAAPLAIVDVLVARRVPAYEIEDSFPSGAVSLVRRPNGSYSRLVLKAATSEPVGGLAPVDSGCDVQATRPSSSNAVSVAFQVPGGPRLLRRITRPIPSKSNWLLSVPEALGVDVSTFALVKEAPGEPVA